MKNDLTPNFQPPTSYAGFSCSLFREPCSENWYVDQRRTGWDAMFTFSGKERDAETGYGYFGARYYDSDLSIWLSVDPLASKYPSLSPYVYCANNPVKLVDPDGRWIPGLDDDGNTFYIAEKGDDFSSFQRQFTVSREDAQKIFDQSNLKTDTQFQSGETIEGSVVKNVTGNSVLKGNWHNMTDSQKAAQLMFGILHGKMNRSIADNNTYAINVSDYIDNFYVPHTGINLNNVVIAANDRSLINIDQVSIASSVSIGNRIHYTTGGGESYRRLDGTSGYSYNFEVAKNNNAGLRLVAINLSVPTKSDHKFSRTFRNRF